MAEFNREALRPEARAEAERILPLYEEIGFAPSFRPGELDAATTAGVIEVALASPLHLNNSRHATAQELEGILASASG